MSIFSIIAQNLWENNPPSRRNDPGRYILPVGRNISLAFFPGMCYSIQANSLCRCDGMVDVVDSKCVASVFPSSGKGVANSLLFWYSDSSFINIPPAYPSCFFGSVRSRVFIKVCRCVGTGRRGGLKILWANPPCGFDSRHRHQNCFDALCFGAIFYCPIGPARRV